MKKLIARIDSVMSQCSGLQIHLVALLTVVLISTIDFVVGYEIAVSIFFLIPVAIATWYISHRAGIHFSILCAIIWFAIDYHGHPYANPIAPYWNALVRMGFFLITEELLNQMKVHLGNEKRLSRTDNLTGLLNGRGFAEKAENLFGLAARHNRPLALAHIDLDNFKQVNDELGHSEGDKVLRVISGKLLSSLRVTDVAGRLGGDEFAIVLPETDAAGAKSMFATLRDALLQETRKHNWPISFSIGVVSFDAPAFSLDEAIRIADTLMYQVKASGKNNILYRHYPASGAHDQEHFELPHQVPS